MGLMNILHVGVSGMNTASQSLLTTSHNIANAGTDGYSRQRTNVSSILGMATVNTQMGGGCQVTDVSRTTDIFLVNRIREQGAMLSEYDQVDMSLRDIELIFGSVENDHLGTNLDRFFTSWSELSAAPTQESLREAVYTSAQMLVNDLNTMSQSLANTAEDLDAELAAAVAGANGILDAIADLNGQIIVVETGGSDANDLRDQRDRLMAELSSLAHAETIERDDGSLDVIIAGRTLVSRNHVQHLEAAHVESSTSGFANLSITAGSRDYELDLPSGRLRGIIEARDEKILGARESLDALAAELIERVNELHAQGRTTGGSGQMFFTGTTAGSISISEEIVADRTLIATSRTGLDGDMDIAREIASIGGIGLDAEDGDSLLDVYASLLVELAADAQGSEDRVEMQTQIVDALGERLESVRGVSLDEEAVNMARYQNAYDASARMIAAAQEMFDTLLQMI